MSLEYMQIRIAKSPIRQSVQTLSLGCLLLIFSSCTSPGSVREFVESEGFKTFCGCSPKDKSGALATSEEEALGTLEVGSLEKLGETNYLEKMYKGIKRSYEYSGTAFTPTDTGLVALGIELKRIEDEKKLREILLNIDGDVSFATGSANLTPKAKEIIDKIANALEAYPETKVRIGGHTDSVGSFGGNLALSKNRAKAVKEEIQNGRNIAEQRFTEVDGYADKFKVVNTMRAEAKNRRTEIYVGTIKLVL